MPRDNQAIIMRRGGYATATEVAQLAGYAHVGTIHRMITGKKLRAIRAGRSWYIDLASLVDHFAGAPPILERVLTFLRKELPESPLIEKVQRTLAGN